MFKRLLLCSFVILLAACAGPAPIKPDATLSEQALDANPRIAQQQLKQYLLSAEGVERAKTLLKLAQLQIASQDIDEADQSLKGVQQDLLAQQQQVEWMCLRAQVLHYQGLARDGVKILPKNQSNYPVALQMLVLKTQALVLKGASYKIEATRAKVDLHDLLADDKLRSNNAKSILNSLSALPGDSLAQLQQKHLSPAMDSWLSFVQLTKPQLFSLDGFDTAVQQWRSQHIYQSIPPSVIEEIRTNIRGKQSYPEKIALLLPMSSRFSKQARSIRDGFFAAYYDYQGDDKPEIFVIDSAATINSLEDKIAFAQQQGAGMIVGPLLKSAIEQVHQIPQLPLPVLALNYLEEPDGAHDEEPAPTKMGLYQFGLLPEDEARQAAQLALRRNQTRAVVMVPKNIKGQRMAEAFAETFQANGGTVLSTQSYDPAKKDFSRAIKNMLNVQQSQSRKSVLQAVLRRNVEFIPRIREDIDVIYLVANPTQARGIKPQLKFYDAGDIDVLANSQIFNGQTNPQLDKDINGVVFTQTPWLLKAADTPLHQQLKSLWPADMALNSKLYALGADAFTLLPYLSRMQSDSAYTLDGHTGTLSISQAGKIQRQLLWARFVKGLVELEDNSLLDLDDTLGEQQDNNQQATTSSAE